MSWFSELVGSGVNKIVDSVGNAIDKIVTSDEERLILKNELAKIQNEARAESLRVELEYDKELTSRHAADMTSDDVWSKRIRPAALAFLVAVVALLAVTDGNIVWGEYTFSVRQDYIDLFKTLLLVAFSFYFGGRSWEKVTKIKGR